MKRNILKASVILVGLVVAVNCSAQEVLPSDNGLATYHTSPRYRASESHPLRILAYIVHPIGWMARELVFRPISYFAASTEKRKSIMGYREPYDFRETLCFSSDDNVADCRAFPPFNYGEEVANVEEETTPESWKGEAERHVFFPDVNFDFDKRTLNELGMGKVRQIADLLKQEEGLTVVLEGHTDYLGSEEYNKKLGMDRAEAVKKALIDLGISEERLSTVSFGESSPIYPDEEAWARAVNRRVSVREGE